MDGLDIACEQSAGDQYKIDPTACYIRTPVTLAKNDKLNFVHVIEPNDIKIIEFKEIQSEIPLIEIFNKFQNLEVLVLETETQELSEGDFKEARNLRVLRIQKGLEIIPANILSDANNLTIINFERNRISEIENYAFDGLDNLQILDLSFNKLKILRRRTFKGLKNLEILNLNFNQINTIEDETFKLPTLKTLSLGHNSELRSLADNLFVDVPSVQFLSLYGTQLQNIPQSVYNLQNLRQLSLNSNNISEIDIVALSKLPRLASVNLSWNNLQFTKPPSQQIHLSSESPVTYLSIDYDALSNEKILNSLAVFSHVEQLHIVDGKLTRVSLDHRKLRELFPSLKSIYLSLMQTDYIWLRSLRADFQKSGINVVSI